MNQNQFLFFSYERQKRSKRQQHLILSNEGWAKIQPAHSKRTNRREKFFPSDFFNNSSKPESNWRKRQVIRSAARKNVLPLSRDAHPLDYVEHKNLGLNPFKGQTNQIELSWDREFKVNKTRPRSYRVWNRNYLQPKVNPNDLSFLQNQNGIDDSLVIFRKDNNSSALNDKIKNLKFK